MNTAVLPLASDLHTQRPRDEDYLGPNKAEVPLINVEVDHVTMGSQ